ncbi:hypothetical protein APQ14_05875 [Vibrio toranzoniae]|uniref:Uncharacterized protein n=1 Tax=Vibrio toranzoniae TaxID=1194427 RepID=A0A109D982_9VIBR|nr:hypothetical protein [Vibrio toranzoniae]KWU01227.1 hypothetical protein APQ14_05875 [Vibrio toranzoniae]SBS38626.1 hypothetical protein VTO7225_03199 [Vibrio toranzoniae]
MNLTAKNHALSAGQRDVYQKYHDELIAKYTLGNENFEQIIFKFVSQCSIEEHLEGKTPACVQETPPYNNRGAKGQSTDELCDNWLNKMRVIKLLTAVRLEILGSRAPKGFRPFRVCPAIRKDRGVELNLLEIEPEKFIALFDAQTQLVEILKLNSPNPPIHFQQVFDSLTGKTNSGRISKEQFSKWANWAKKVDDEIAFGDWFEKHCQSARGQRVIELIYRLVGRSLKLNHQNRNTDNDHRLEELKQRSKFHEFKGAPVELALVIPDHSTYIIKNRRQIANALNLATGITNKFTPDVIYDSMPEARLLPLAKKLIDLYIEKHSLKVEFQSAMSYRDLIKSLTSDHTNNRLGTCGKFITDGAIIINNKGQINCRLLEIFMCRSAIAGDSITEGYMASRNRKFDAINKIEAFCRDINIQLSLMSIELQPTDQPIKKELNINDTKIIWTKQMLPLIQDTLPAPTLSLQTADVDKILAAATYAKIPDVVEQTEQAKKVFPEVNDKILAKISEAVLQPDLPAIKRELQNIRKELKSSAPHSRKHLLTRVWRHSRTTWGTQFIDGSRKLVNDAQHNYYWADSLKELRNMIDQDKINMSIIPIPSTTDLGIVHLDFNQDCTTIKSTANIKFPNSCSDGTRRQLRDGNGLTMSLKSRLMQLLEIIQKEIGKILTSHREQYGKTRYCSESGLHELIITNTGDLDRLATLLARDALLKLKIDPFPNVRLPGKIDLLPGGLVAGVSFNKKSRDRFLAEPQDIKDEILNAKLKINEDNQGWKVSELLNNELRKSSPERYEEYFTTFDISISAKNGGPRTVHRKFILLLKNRDIKYVETAAEFIATTCWQLLSERYKNEH